MIAAPLEVPLRTLAPNRLVWIQRGGLVYPYPARIVRDIANDLYVSDGSVPFTTGDMGAGRVTADYAARGTPRTSLEALCQAAWNHSWKDYVAGFDAWWESVDSSLDPEVLGAAASFAARNVLTFSLFKHRYMIDTPSQSL